MEDEIKPNDPEEMIKSSEFSFLCREFQKKKLNLKEKQEVIKRLIEDFRKARDLLNV